MCIRDRLQDGDVLDFQAIDANPLSQMFKAKMCIRDRPIGAAAMAPVVGLFHFRFHLTLAMEWKMAPRD